MEKYLKSKTKHAKPLWKDDCGEQHPLVSKYWQGAEKFMKKKGGLDCVSHLKVLCVRVRDGEKESCVATRFINVQCFSCIYCMC